MFEDLTKDNQSLMIVKGDGKEARYAEMLLQIIGKQIPNIESSQPITESEYNNSFVTIDNIPKGKIIFFGNGKEAEIQGKAVNWQYDLFGMRYGWLGIRCIITASPDMISADEMDGFAYLYNSKIKDICSLVDNIKLTEIKYSGKTNKQPVFHNKLQYKFDKQIYELKNAARDLTHNFKKKDLWKRQYELLVYKFITEGLMPFMENLKGKIPANQIIIVYEEKDSVYSHLLHNLIQQCTDYDAAEYTEKMFIDNRKSLSSKNKIIFLGKTKASKERWNNDYTYRFDENGMKYGWEGNHAFVCIDFLQNETEREKFIEVYNHERETFENEAKAYSKSEGSKVGKNAATALNVFQLALSPFSLLFLPGLITVTSLVVIGKATDKIIDNAKTIVDFNEYQYQLLLRKFVFNGLKEFMES